MNLMTQTAAIEDDITASTYSILELEYYLGQIPDLSDLEMRLSEAEMKQMELMDQLTANDVKIAEFNQKLTGLPDPLLPEIDALELSANMLDA